MDIFREIENRFTSHRASGLLDEALTGWRARRADLSESDIDALVRTCRGVESSTQLDKDRVLIALCRQACGDPPDELAGHALCWLLLPGLLDQIRELGRGRTADREDLAAELLAGMWEGAARVDVATRCVARHLLRCARRRALRSLKESRVRVDRRPVVEAADDRGSHEDLVDDPLARAIDEGVLAPDQAELVFADRASIAHVAARLGLTLVAAQQARHRARRRLLDWLQTS